jgi:predicted glutamine amidotransferase
MCRLLGVAANTTVYLTFSLLLAPNSFRSQSKENPDGWGIAAYNEDWSLWKEAYSAGESSEFEKRSHEASGRIIISHLREATVGGRNVENTHPFQSTNWVLAHNGTVRNSGQLSIASDFRPQGATDSEQIFCALLSILQQRNGTILDLAPSKVKIAMNEIFELCVKLDPKCKLNLLFSDGVILYAFRHKHPLFWLLREPRSRDSLQSQTLEMQEAKAKKGEKAVLIATEKLTDEAWQEVPSDTLLFVNPNDVLAGLQAA